MDEPGGARRSQEEPGGARRSQEEPFLTEAKTADMLQRCLKTRYEADPDSSLRLKSF